MKLDTRLKLFKEPILVLAVFLFFGGLITIIKREQPKTSQIKKEAVTIVKKDTTEWRKQYYEHLYNTK